MFADIADEHELETGERREGVIYAARSFVIKATGAVGVILGGMLLDFIAFPRGAAAGTVDRTSSGCSVSYRDRLRAIFTLLGLVLYGGLSPRPPPPRRNHGGTGSPTNRRAINDQPARKSTLARSLINQPPTIAVMPATTTGYHNP